MLLPGSQIPRKHAPGQFRLKFIPSEWVLTPGGAYSRGVDSQEKHTPGESTPQGSIFPLSQTPRESILPVITSSLNNFESLKINSKLS